MLLFMGHCLWIIHWQKWCLVTQNDLEQPFLGQRSDKAVLQHYFNIVLNGCNIVPNFQAVLC